MADKKYRLKFGMSDGTEQSVEFTAPQGDKGDPGITPVVAVNDITGGHRVTITTGNNVQTIDVLDGKNGDPGKDGITPTVSVTEIEGGHRVTITTGSNVQSFDVLDGKGTADAVAWENVTGKPFNESLTGTAVVNGDTLSWDGNLDAMPIVVTPNNYNKWVYVSDNVPTMEQISAGHTLGFKAYSGNEINIGITPSESENYIYVGDIDGQYLYIIKKPCTVGSMTFERAGIYFYSDSKATIYTCRLTINGYTFTAMGSIKDAYIPQTIARKSDIPQGGGAQVQSDYTQHDATQPDYIRNRPFWPSFNPILLNEALNFSNYMAMITEQEAGKELKAPTVGKRYTINAGGTFYTGIAAHGTYDFMGATIPGIMIADEQGSGAAAFHASMNGEIGWGVIIADPDLANRNALPVIIVEDEPDKYTTARMPDDLKSTIVKDGVGTAYCVYEGDVWGAALAIMNDGASFEIVADVNGVETVYTNKSENITFDNDMPMLFCDGYPALLIVPDFLTSTIGIPEGVYFLDAGLGFTVKSFKANYPGIFAPTIPEKKIPAECLPDGIGGPCKLYIGSTEGDDITRVYKTAERTADVRMSKAELYSMVQSGRAMWHVIKFGDSEMYVHIPSIIFESGKDYAEVAYSANGDSAYTAEYTG